MKSVLIVDDEESIRVSLKAMLARNGYVVTICDRAKDAVDLLRSEDIDVAFIDVKMPEMDGIELTRQIVKNGILTTIIIMSAYGSADDARKAMGAGAYDYITKPFKPDEVILTLTKAEERESLRRENASLKAYLDNRENSYGIIYKSNPMARVMQLLEKVAKVDSTVLITGESGTGKELVARAVHKISKRSKKHLVAVNCGAIPHSLIESELFGYKKGAFTDAGSDKEGFFKQADGGTLFLDEIGDLPLSLQVKLLRVLQEGTFRPLGAPKDEKVDVRIIAATAIDLNMSVKTGDFREDLFYRLNVLPVKLPPLRERIEDILLICDHFIKTNNIKFANKIKGLSKETSKMLISYQWPGNVRELQNAMERAHVLCDGEYIAKQDLPPQIAQSSGIIQSALSQDELSIKKTTRIIEEELIRKALAKTGGNRTKASKLLEISHRALLYKIKEFNI